MIGAIIINSNYPERQKYVTNLENFFKGTEVQCKQVSGVFTDKVIYDARYDDNRPLSKGQIGCSLAHLDALKCAIDLDLDYAFIFEDDVEITAPTYDLLKTWLSNLPDYDVCLITNVGSFVGTGHDGRIHTNTYINDCIYMTCPFGTQAYYVSKDIIKLLYETQMKMLIHNKIYIADGLHIHCEKAPNVYLNVITPIRKDLYARHAGIQSIIEHL